MTRTQLSDSMTASRPARSRLRAAAILTGLSVILTSCASASTEASGDGDCDPAEVTLTTAYTEVGDAPLKAAKAVLEERYPGIVIEEGQRVSSGYNELTQLVAADLAAGREVDVVMSGNSQLRFWVDSFDVQPLDETILHETYDRSYLDIGTVDGVRYMAPFQVSFPALFYNATLMEEAGLDPENPPATYSELFDAARALAPYSEGVPLAIPTDTLADWIVQAAVQSAGGTFIDEEGRPGFDSPEGVAGLDLYGLPAREGLTDIVPYDDLPAVFVTGTTPLVISTIAGTAQLAEAIGDAFEWGVAPMPITDGGEARFPAGGNGWLILSGDPCERRYATELVAEMLSPDVLEEALRVSSYVPVDREVRERLLADDSIPDQQQVGYSYEGSFTPWGGWPGDTAPEANQIIFDMTQRIVGEGVPVEEAVDEASSKISELVG